LVTGVVSRVLPLLRLRPAYEGLRASVSSHAVSAPRLRRLLVATQLALAVVLSTTAVLLALSLRKVVLIDPGFAASHVLSFRLSAYPWRYPQKADVLRLFGAALVRLAAVPGIEHVAAGSAVPLAGSLMGTAVGVEGYLAAMADRPTAGWQTV